MAVSQCVSLEGWRGGGGGMTMPPNLSGAARQLAALPTRSCEEDDTCRGEAGVGTGGAAPSATPVVNTYLSGAARQLAAPSSNSCREARVDSGAGGEAGVGTGGAAPSATPVVNTYRLSPGLMAAFASIGATDSAYSFREVGSLLKKYLFSNVRLFDRTDKLYVNCESDPLGKAFGVTRFHYNDVRRLIVQNITKEQPARGPTGPEPPPVPASSSPSVSVEVSNDSTCRVPAPPGAAPRIPVNGTVASQRTRNGPEGVATGSPEPGSSSNRGRQRALPGQSSPPPLFTCPEIPDSCSDTETVYSGQGYVTEYCLDTEFEFSEDEEDLIEVNSETFEEYELLSDAAKDEKEFSDGDSTVDDVEIAVLTYSLLTDDEKGFWGDNDSDTDEEYSEEDNDPECVSDRWDCLTCGLKNKPFVRYCGKCWQLRKNWLPDRPKKRKRKPRPKKRSHKKGMASREQPSSQGMSSSEDHKTAPASEDSADDSSRGSGLMRTSSDSTTASSSCTQDSGISLSQDLLESQDLQEELVKESCDVERSLSQASTSKEPSQAEKQALEDTEQPKIESRKRKASVTDVMTSKRSKSMNDEDEVPSGDAETLAKEMFNFMGSSAGKTWLNSSDGAKFTRSLQFSSVYQASLTKMIEEQISASTPGSASGTSVLCSICCLRPKNASIIHGRIAHQATCYQCARRLLNDGARCPVCRRKIHMVCKQIIA